MPQGSQNYKEGGYETRISSSSRGGVVVDISPFYKESFYFSLEEMYISPFYKDSF